MKRIISLLLSLSLVFSLAGCKPVNDRSEKHPDSSSAVISQITSQNNKNPDKSDSRSEIIATPSPEPAATPKPTDAPKPTPSPQPEETPVPIDEDGSYFDKENVALYIHIYGKLPANFITKDEARDLGWEGGSVEKYAPGKAIGGDRFGNYEGLLPKKKGRTYTECDIDTDGYHSRGSRRIVFSNDGLIYYTHDHYENFELLYGEE